MPMHAVYHVFKPNLILNKYSYVNDLIMVIIFRCKWHKKYVGNIFLGHQHHYVSKWDVGDRYVMCENETQHGGKFNSKFLLSMNKSWVTNIGHPHDNTSECEVGDWYLKLMSQSSRRCLEIQLKFESHWMAEKRRSCEV